MSNQDELSSSEGAPLLPPELSSLLSSSSSLQQHQSQQQPPREGMGMGMGITQYGATASNNSNTNSSNNNPNNNNNNSHLAAYAMAAAQYDAAAAAGYYPDAAAAAAAATAAYSQQQRVLQQQQQQQAQVPTPPYFYPQMPPPPPQGYYAPTSPHQHHPQPQSYYNYPPPQPQQQVQQVQVQVQPSQLQRPPRASRRRSTGKVAANVPNTPSPTNSSVRKTYDSQQQLPLAFPTPEQQQQQQQNEHNFSNIPPLQDIFSQSMISPVDQHSNPNSNSQQPLLTGSGSGYGSTATTTIANTHHHQQQQQLPPLPNIYNAPPRVPSKSSHRRSNSDAPLRAMQNQHRRVGSGGALNNNNNDYGGSSSNSNNLLPPMHRRVGSSASSSARGRSYSAGTPGQINAFPSTSNNNNNKKPTHRRADSTSSMQTYNSNISVTGSVVSNIKKSSMFGGVDEQTGVVQMHYPMEAVQFVMMDPDSPNNDLRTGHLYMNGWASDFEQFEEYQRITNDMQLQQTESQQPQWESLDKMTSNKILGNNTGCCDCNCNNCNGCLGKTELLPKANYILAVNQDVYRRVMGEISDAHSMPCGLFFCGHHEDVAHPSISIAVVIVLLLFSGMAYVAFFYTA